MFGFKSFADKTEVLFHKGVTCIVGPNGCGKSNISDALRWVLGERSPKHLRSSQMTDVIFAGTEFRKPLGMAEVNLVFDNHTRWLPIDYNEVVITRRLYSSGESEYLINKTRCRYRDIQALIVDTGLGVGSYSMMEQGRVDYILNATPEERRGLIEEAAGVAKFKAQKDEAIRKLTLTEENLTRLRDIVQEVERNIKYAERQAKRAERYKVQLEKLKHMEITKAFMDIDELKNKEKLLSDEMVSIQSEIQSTEDKQNTERARLHEIEVRLGLCEKNLRERLEVRAERKGRFESLLMQIQELKKRRDELETACAKAESEMNAAKARVSELTLQFEADDTGFSESENVFEKENAEELLNEKSAILNRIRSEMDHQRELVEKLRESLFESADLQLKTKNELNSVEAELIREKERRKRLDAVLERVANELEEVRKHLQNLEAERVELLGADNGLLENYNQKISVQTDLEKKLETVSTAIGEHTAEIGELATRIAVLKRLSRKGLLPWSAARVFLDDSEKQTSGALSAAEAVTEVIKPKEGFEHLYHLAVGKFMDAVIVEEEASAHQIIEVLSKKKWGEATILLSDKPMTAGILSDGIASHPLILGPAINFVEFSSKHRGLAELILAGTYVSVSWDREHKAELRGLSEKSRLITEDGMILGPGNRIQVGARSGNSDGEFAANPEAYIASQERLKKLEQETEVLRKQKENLLQELASVREDLRTSEPGLRSTKIKLESSHHMASRLEKDVERLEQERRLTNSDIEDSALRQERLESQVVSLTAHLTELTGAESGAKEKFHKELEKLSQLEREKDLLASEVVELSAEFKHLSDKKELTSKSQASLKSNFDLLTALILEKEKAIASTLEKQKEITENLASIDKELECLKQEEADYSSQIIKLEEETVALKDERQKGSETIEQLHRMIAGFKDNEHAKELERTDSLHHQDTVRQQILQAYKLDLNGLDRSQYGSVSAEERIAMTEQILKIRESLETLGTVNLLAIEEYDELKTRFDFLSTQQTDLETSRESLLEAIRKINRTTRKLFQDTFHQVQSNFEQYYRILFRGGHAELIMLDEENPLESGIDIHVRPPGKKLQHISLLSGGEKALTTIALIFALFKVKPSPFCVLDEVDAPLDEANVDRFLDVLRQFLETTQFLIITHNRKTISTGDTLYGVTMEESGVSSIVSVRVAENGNLANNAAADSAAATTDQNQETATVLNSPSV